MMRSKIEQAIDHLSCIVAGAVLIYLSFTDWSWLWSFPAWWTLGAGLFRLRDMWRERQLARLPIDPRTGRPVGDHGTYEDAVTWFLDQGSDIEDVEFLKWWRMGAAHEEWPEFYAWLKEQGR